jgi:ATP-dependent DNA ligase
MTTIPDAASFAIEPPVEPMLAKAVASVPTGGQYLYEPKWDGFRAIVFRGVTEVFIQSRDLKPLNRYFPDLHAVLLAVLPAGCVVDGEIVIAAPAGLDFDALQMRLHPAASRVATLAARTPASFVAFDVLAVGGRDVRAMPQADRRVLLEQLLANARPPVHLTPVTRDAAVAADWLARFEGAGLDGIVAKRADGAYTPGKRTMIKVKHARTADCVVAGFRWHVKGRDELVGSLLLGLYDGRGTLQHVGVTSAFTTSTRRELATLLAPLRTNALDGHPWGSWAAPPEGTTRMPGGHSRWNAGKDLSWEPLRIERVCEVKYDHMQGTRFRHAAVFVRWRPDKRPLDCGYDQLDVTAPYELSKIFDAGA